jgi:eukaryotic-like serine/threonine-protein kinase
MVARSLAAVNVRGRVYDWPVPLTIAAGTRLGPYEIVSALGSGAMGDVYRARDTRLGRPVAIKILHTVPGLDLSQQALVEARAAARLNHPNIATLHDIVEDMTADGVPVPPFLVMEFVDGRPLTALVAEGPMDVDRALAIGIQLADALGEAHRNGVIHRDVKPANVMVTHGGAVKLLDLGVASVAVDPAMTTRTSLEPRTGGGSAGTPAYMSPQRLTGQVADAQSDVYGLGVLLFELLTGRRPFDAPDMLSLAVRAATAPTPLVSSLRPDVPALVDGVVSRAMAKDPTARFKTADELRAALVAVRGGDASPGGPSRAPIWIAVAVVVAIAVATGMWKARPAPHLHAPIAILPAVSTGDTVVESLGVGMVSMLADNLASAPGLTIVSGARLAHEFLLPSRDLSKAARELGAGYTIDLQLSGTAAHVRLDAALMERGHDAPIWHGSHEGNPLEVNRWVSDQLAGTLEDIGILSRRPTPAERERMRRLPTEDPAAFVSYATGQARLEGTDPQRDAQDAIAAFGDAITRDPSFALALAALSEAYGRMYGSTSDPAWAERAKEEADKALAIDPGSARVHLSIGLVDWRRGHLEEALRHARLAVQISPTSDDAHRLLGNVLSDSGDVEGAVAALQRAIELRPDYSLNHSTLGFVQGRAGRHKQAVTAFRRAAALEPSAANFRRLGYALHLSGNVQEAIGNYQHAVQLGEDPLAYSNLAFSYYSAGRYSEALGAWQDSARLSKTPTPATLRNLGDVYERLKQTEKSRDSYTAAIAAAERLLGVNPNDADQIALIAVCYAKLGRNDQAALRAAEALSLRPDDNNVLFKVAVVETLGGDKEHAFAHLKAALERGYPAAFARGDFDLDGLRNDPRFVTLVAIRDDD